MTLFLEKGDQEKVGDEEAEEEEGRAAYG